MSERLNIVDEQGNVVGEDTRQNIHRKGLLHREVHVWLYRSNGDIIFQRRSPSTDTYPNLLDATVGGHVEIGKTLEETAVAEVLEETGLAVQPTDLTFLMMYRGRSHDQVTGMTNNVLRPIYAYRYDGPLDGLKIEAGKGTGFEVWPYEKVLHPSDEDRKRFIPLVYKPDYLVVFKKIQELAEK